MSHHTITPPQAYIDQFHSLTPNQQRDRIAYTLKQLTIFSHLLETKLSYSHDIFSPNLYTHLIATGICSQDEKNNTFITPHGHELIILLCAYLDGDINN